MKQRYRFAVVDWVDSSSPSGRVWWTVDQVSDVIICEIRSVGYVIRRNATEIVLAAGMSEGHMSDVFGIPTGCIKRVKYIKLPK